MWAERERETGIPRATVEALIKLKKIKKNEEEYARRLKCI